jgi:hypothetical protein
MGVVIEVAGEISFLARGKLSAQSRDWRAASRSLDLSGKSVRRMNALCLSTVSTGTLGIRGELHHARQIRPSLFD